MAVKKKIRLLFLTDLIIIWFSIVSSYLFRYDGHIPSEEVFAHMIFYSMISCVICAASMIYFQMYRRMWQYASIGELTAICKAVVVGWALSYIVTFIFVDQEPLSVALRQIETMILLIGGVRLAWRILRMKKNNTDDNRTHVLLVGAGDCGALIAKELMNPSLSDRKPVGFIDDDPGKLGLRVMGLPVIGNRSSIPTAVKAFDVKEIIIAMPAAPKADISEIINICMPTGVKVKIIPAIHDLISGKLSFSAIRDVMVEDLLGRDPVVIDTDGISCNLTGKTVLVTGAGGSIGSELCRQIASFSPAKLLLLGHGENSIYTIEQELRRKFPALNIEPIIADIQDRIRIDEVFDLHRPNVVFHAAAHKHVPLMERNPSEAVKNNVFGTKTVADAADLYGTERFVLISSDKAVNPSSVMGTTKRIAEMYIQSLNMKSKTKFAAVRFGNVLGSRGSVIPLFKEQIARGGPVTVTHPEMVRYFMTIPEAVQLVIQAGALSNGGETFLLDMGEPVRILDLAEDLIRLSGFEPHSDIAIEFTGIRSGEKLFEELLLSEEEVAATRHERIFTGKPGQLNHFELELQFARLERVLAKEHHAIKGVLEDMVPSAYRGLVI